MTTQPLPHHHYPLRLRWRRGPRQMDDPAWMDELRTWANRMSKPKAILLFSATGWSTPCCWCNHPVPLVYDYYNFTERYYQVQYPAPTAPE